MKYTLVAWLVFCSIGASAQESVPEHRLFGDIGSIPGFSITYNYIVTKHFAAGGGIQGYTFAPAIADPRKFTPGVFAGMRFNIRPEKKNQFFTFLDLGIDIYKQDKGYHRDSTVIYYVPHNNGFYTGLGFGYLRGMTKRGGGPYASVKMVLNWSKLNEYSLIATEQDRVLAAANGGIAFSLGFKY